MTTIEDVEDVVGKLLSDKARLREEGLKLLNNYLEVAGNQSFCTLLDSQTILLQQQERIPSSTWPGVLHALCQCISMEVVSSKKRGPKPALAKALRTFIQRAEDFNRSGHKFLLLRKMKKLFHHLSEMLQDAPIFISDYSQILCQLLPDIEYRLCLGKKTYTDLLHIFLDKVKAVVHKNPLESSIMKEEAFRLALTLLSLVQHPPGDISDRLRCDIVDGYCDIFSHLRDDGRVAKKLIAALNITLLNDGLNLGDAVVKIHSSFRHFLVRSWLTTRDFELKDGLVLYLRAQLKLRRIIVSKDCGVLQEILELIEKELDLTGAFLTGSFRDEKPGCLSKSLCSFFELAATVLFEVGAGVKLLVHTKRRRKESIDLVIKDRLMNGSFSWCIASAFFIRHYGCKLGKEFVINWLEAVTCNLERLFSEATNSRSFQSSLWTLRCLEELCFLWESFSSNIGGPGTKYPQPYLAKGGKLWQSIWDTLLRWVPLFKSHPYMLEESFRLLGNLTSQGLVPSCNIPPDFWDLLSFTEYLHSHTLYFIAMYFITNQILGAFGDSLLFRKNLLRCASAYLHPLGAVQFKVSPDDRVSPRIFSAAVLAVCTGSFTLPSENQILGRRDRLTIDGQDDWLEFQEHEECVEASLEALDWSKRFNSAHEAGKGNLKSETRFNAIPFSTSDELLQELVIILQEETGKVIGSKDLSSLLKMSTILVYCIYGVLYPDHKRGQLLTDSGFQEKVRAFCDSLLDCFITVVDVGISVLEEQAEKMSLAVVDVANQLSSATVSNMQELVNMLSRSNLMCQERSFCSTIQRLICAIYKTYLAVVTFSQKTSSIDVTKSQMSLLDNVSTSSGSRDSIYMTRIIDMDLDVNTDAPIINVGLVSNSDSSLGFINIAAAVSNCSRWKRNCILMMSSLGKLFPEAALQKFKELLVIEKDEKLHGEVLQSLCHCITSSSLGYLPDLVRILRQMLQRGRECEPLCVELLTTIDILLSRLLSLKKADPVNGWIELPQDVIFETSTIVKDLADMSMMLWTSRSKLAHVISSLVFLDPNIVQPLIEKLVTMLHDPEYQVRLLLSKLVSVFFETWSGHIDLFQDICSNFGLKLPMATNSKVISASEVCQLGAEKETFGETAILTLGEIAAVSDVIESEAVFMIVGHAALRPSHRSIAAIVLDNLSYRLGYSNRLKYLEQLARGIFNRWVRANLPLSALVEMRELFKGKIEPKEFLQTCNSLLLPHLLLQGHEDELTWLAKANSIPVPLLVREHFASIFGSILPLHCSQNLYDREKAAQVLQGSMLASAEISEDKRDQLIKKHMVSIISTIFSLCNSYEEPEEPFFSKAKVTLAVRTVIDGFMETNEVSEDGGVIDKMHIFRPDRVFMLLLQTHHQIDAAHHPRHRCHLLVRLGALIEVIQNRVLVPSTWRYLVHIVLDSMEFKELQFSCCQLLGVLIDKLEHLSTDTAAWMLGDQLQLIVSRLVSCCLSFCTNKRYIVESAVTKTKNVPDNQKNVDISSSVVSLLDRIITNADHSLYPYIKELEPFPAFPVFKQMEELHLELRLDITLKEEFLKFVQKANDISPSLRVKSLQRLYQEFINIDSEIERNWLSDPKAIVAVWKIVRLCKEHSGDDFHSMVGDLLAAVGISDSNAAIFHLPEDAERMQSDTLNGSRREHAKSTFVSLEAEPGTMNGLVMSILLLLRAYLLDETVCVIEQTATALKGILATEIGQRTFKLLKETDRAYLEVYSTGIDMKVVEDILEQRSLNISREALSIEDPMLWEMVGKSFETWICNLTYALIQYTSDPILKLCQELVLQKPPLAELIFPHVLNNLSSELGTESDTYMQMAEKVQKYIFDDSNKSTRAIQVWLDALNFLRQAYMLSKIREPPVMAKRDGAKQGRKSGSSEEKLHLNSNNSPHCGSDQEELRYKSAISWPKVYWLQVSYLLTAKAAQRCGAYFTSALYIEQWCEENFGQLVLGEPDFSSDSLPWHMDLLLNVYTRINEPDGVYGVIRSHKLISQLRMYEHEGNWNKSLENYDLLLRTVPLSVGKATASQGLSAFMDKEYNYATSGSSQTLQLMKGLLRSLNQMGCSHVSEMYCHGLVKEQGGIDDDVEFKELQSEAAWRSGNWDLNFCTPLSSNKNSYLTGEVCVDFNAKLHSCFRSLVDGDEQMFHTQIKETKKGLVSFLAHTSMESAQNVYPAIIRLQMLNALSHAWGMRWPTRNSCAPFGEAPKVNTETIGGPLTPSDVQMTKLTSYWENTLKQAYSNYDLLEPAATFFVVLYRILGQNTFLTHHLVQFATLARKAGRLNQATTAAYQLKALFQENTTMAKVSNIETSQRENEISRWSTALQVQEAKILWAREQHEMAVSLLKHILQKSDMVGDSAAVHCLAGKWLAETRSASSHTILEGYLQKAVELAKQTSTSLKQKCKTYYHLAHYSDALYRSYEERLSSNEWQSALRLRQHKAKEFETLIKRLKHASKDDKRDYTLKALELQKQLSMDNEQAQRLQDDKENFLMIALESYRNCLITCNKYDIRVVFRIISLWFNLSCNPLVNSSMLETIKLVQSFKFLPLMYQIASRLGPIKDVQAQSNFQTTVAFLVKKMAIEHPYHTLYQLLALAKGDRVKDKQRNKSVFVVDLEKKAAAENLLNELSAYHPDVIQQMKQMIEMYIRLAELETNKEDTNKRLPVPRDIRSIRQLELVPVITAPLLVDPSCQYKPGSFPHFKGLSDRIIVMNGINAPKVVECIGSDGCKYRQLAKSGNDDLRQDAVMEQLFSLVNQLLQDHPDTRKRQLSIRTYKVIPFTPSAGVLEWVDGTIPLGEYLLGSNRNEGAHARYGDGDWTFMKCREYMSTETDKRKAFQTVCSHFRPVMHKFFLERFGQPADWFEKRLAYTRSIATSSMVGYIVGLGDRHSMNILIDQETAEVVHIDFGVAFEQGLMLKTPERVPFRLTRDIVDGMGVSGTEGVFRRCCEATLSVMRANKEALLTIIEVFIHDPLYKWALSPLKALQRQQETDDIEDDESSEANGSAEEVEGNKDATRALLRVKQKLDGYEQGEMRSLQGQVQQLIQDAQDPEHLAQMFPGWGAWL